ncbi:hypothetical protein ETK61_06920 [Bacillus subtilis]|nr:hypothetical protein ETK61_06920 [Bacillus subtilis]
MRIADSWILSEIIRFLICMVVFFAVTFLLDAFFQTKKSHINVWLFLHHLIRNIINESIIMMKNSKQK